MRYVCEIFGASRFSSFFNNIRQKQSFAYGDDSPNESVGG